MLVGFVRSGRHCRRRSVDGPTVWWTTFQSAKCVNRTSGACHHQSCAFIESCSPWENGYIESVNARLHDELLNGEIFYTLKEAQILVESWRRHYNAVRPHTGLGYRPPAPETIVMPSWPSGGAERSQAASSAKKPPMH